MKDKKFSIGLLLIVAVAIFGVIVYTQLLNPSNYVEGLKVSVSEYYPSGLDGDPKKGYVIVIVRDNKTNEVVTNQFVLTPSNAKSDDGSIIQITDTQSSVDGLVFWVEFAPNPNQHLSSFKLRIQGNYNTHTIDKTLLLSPSSIYC